MQNISNYVTIQILHARSVKQKYQISVVEDWLAITKYTLDQLCPTCAPRAVQFRYSL